MSRFTEPIELQVSRIVAKHNDGFRSEFSVICKAMIQQSIKASDILDKEKLIFESVLNGNNSEALERYINFSGDVSSFSDRKKGNLVHSFSSTQKAIGEAIATGNHDSGYEAADAFCSQIARNSGFSQRLRLQNIYADAAMSVIEERRIPDDPIAALEKAIKEYGVTPSEIVAKAKQLFDAALEITPEGETCKYIKDNVGDKREAAINKFESIHADMTNAAAELDALGKDAFAPLLKLLQTPTEDDERFIRAYADAVQVLLRVKRHEQAPDPTRPAQEAQGAGQDEGLQR